MAIFGIGLGRFMPHTAEEVKLMEDYRRRGCWMPISASIPLALGSDVFPGEEDATSNDLTQRFKWRVLRSISEDEFREHAPDGELLGYYYAMVVID